MESWSTLREPVLFDHSMTGFSLDFSHTSVSCLSCHQSLTFSFVATACADCHEDPHRGDLSSDCESCHTPEGWNQRSEISDTHSSTLLPLTGGHANVDCASCHKQEPPFEFGATPTECVSCHAINYQETDRPNHLALGLSTECRECHTSRTWHEAHFEGGPLFNHDGFFPLIDAHAVANCESCHRGGHFSGTPQDCHTCHREDFQNSTQPSHVAAGFPVTCELCHTQKRWQGANFDHDSVFKLTGAHRSTDCQSCHQDGQYKGTPRDCYACHRTDYDGTTDPNHRTAGFPTDCKSCHNTSGWQGADFDHDSVFKLTGAHRSTDCESCHQNGQYKGTPRDCYTCHRTDYDGTTDPNHRTAGFPTDCKSCHNTSGWLGAQFIHAFPLNSGPHKILACVDCHVVQQNYSAFECIYCHDHRQQKMDDKHLGEVPGYVWQSQACYSCHPTGRE